MEKNAGTEKTNFKQWIVVGVLVLAIALIIYFMVATKKKTETYNQNLSANITGLLNANKTYYIKDYDKEAIHPMAFRNLSRLFCSDMTIQNLESFKKSLNSARQRTKIIFSLPKEKARKK